ncbi:hypothetical protein K502DRAFT_325981 [Neoconidiobolus thromboides FSU 785]|nr:hypothetical protein K502DRAFT_325981 [Neoconidiobolus thromboides FSU 785]
MNNTYFNDFNSNMDQKEMNNDLMNNRINNFKPANVNNTYLPRVQNNKSIHNSDRNSPCNTLFIGNLLFGTLEQDIVNLFSDVKGYQRLSLTYKIPGGNNESTRDPDSIKQMENNRQHIQNMIQKNTNKDLSTLPGPICFVEFESTQDATNAILSKNGELLDIKLLHDSNIIKSITSKNVRLSFSKNPFGVKPNPSLNDALNNNPKLSISAMPFYPPTNTTNNQSKMLPSQLHPTYTSIVTGNNLFHNHSTPTTPLSSQFNF